MSNAVIAGLRELKQQQFGYDRLRAQRHRPSRFRPQPRSIRRSAIGDARRRRRSFAYDRLVLSPGIDFRWGAIQGYDEAALAADAARLQGRRAGRAAAPPARSDGGRRHGGDLVAGQSGALPARALRARQPDRALSQDQEAALQGDRARRQGQLHHAEAVRGRLEGALSRHDRMGAGCRAAARSPRSMSTTRTLSTDFDKYKAAVANVIPPQKAGHVAELAGVADRTGWCPVDPVTFDSKLQPNIHVIGDAAIAGAMPRSASAAHSQAKICAAAIAQLLAGKTPAAPTLTSSCYSLIAPDYAISQRGTYRPVDDQYTEADGGPVISPPDAPRATRKAEAERGRRLVSRPSPARCSDEAPRRCLVLAVALVLRAGRAQEALRPYTIVGDAIPESLTGEPGDPARGRAIVVKRESTCLLCHSGPFPEERFQGDLAPDLKGAGARWSEGELRLRLVDAARLNPATIMPSYYVVDGLTRVAPSLSRQAGADGRADRGRGGLSDDAEGLSMRTRWTDRHGTTRRAVPRRRRRRGARADRCGRRRRRPSIDEGGDPPGRRRGRGEARQGQARRAAAGRERQHRGDGRLGRKPDDARRTTSRRSTSSPRRTRSPTSSASSSARAPARPRSRPASGSPTPRPSSRSAR